MRCDVLAVGTELLLGQITNSQWIGEQFAAAGVDSLLQVKVGNSNLGRVESVLRRMLADADAVLMCGGLGPTHDDLTREAIAAVMGVPMRQDDAVADFIRELFASRGGGWRRTTCARRRCRWGPRSSRRPGARRPD